MERNDLQVFPEIGSFLLVRPQYTVVRVTFRQYPKVVVPTPHPPKALIIILLDSVFFITLTHLVVDLQALSLDYKLVTVSLVNWYQSPQTCFHMVCRSWNG